MPDEYHLLKTAYNLAQAVIKEALIPTYLGGIEKDEAKKRRVRFARKSPLVQLWADCAGLDEKRIRQAIILANL